MKIKDFDEIASELLPPIAGYPVQFIGFKSDVCGLNVSGQIFVDAKACPDMVDVFISGFDMLNASDEAAAVLIFRKKLTEAHNALKSKVECVLNNLPKAAVPAISWLPDRLHTPDGRF